MINSSLAKTLSLSLNIDFFNTNDTILSRGDLGHWGL